MNAPLVVGEKPRFRFFRLYFVLRLNRWKERRKNWREDLLGKRQKAGALRESLGVQQQINLFSFLLFPRRYTRRSRSTRSAPRSTAYQRLLLLS